MRSTRSTAWSHRAAFSSEVMPVVYDRLWDRWIITAPAFAENFNTQFFFIAVSQTGDATGSYWSIKSTQESRRSVARARFSIIHR